MDCEERRNCACWWCPVCEGRLSWTIPTTPALLPPSLPSTCLRSWTDARSPCWVTCSSWGPTKKKDIEKWVAGPWMWRLCSSPWESVANSSLRRLWPGAWKQKRLS